MSNPEGWARSNYVKVKDEEGLLKALNPFNIIINKSSKGFIFSISEEEISWSLIAYDENDIDSQIYFDPEIDILPYLEDGEVLILIEAGHEKLRYIYGGAKAYKLGRKPVTIDLRDIYAKAAYLFMVDEDSITMAEY